MFSKAGNFYFFIFIATLILKWARTVFVSIFRNAWRLVLIWFYRSTAELHFRVKWQVRLAFLQHSKRWTWNERKQEQSDIPFFCYDTVRSAGVLRKFGSQFLIPLSYIHFIWVGLTRNIIMSLWGFLIDQIISLLSGEGISCCVWMQLTQSRFPGKG